MRGMTPSSACIAPVNPYILCQYLYSKFIFGLKFCFVLLAISDFNQLYLFLYVIYRFVVTIVVFNYSSLLFGQFNVVLLSIYCGKHI